MRVCTLHLAITLGIRLFSREIIKKYASYCIIACVLTWSEWRGSNPRPDGPKPMSELSARGLAPSLALSGTPAVPLWNSIGLFISGTAFGFWDLCGIEFCILKVLPTGFTSNSGCFLPQRAAQKLRRINKEINPTTKKQQADLDDSQPAERRCLFDVLFFSSNACSFARECNADFYN